MQARSNEVHAGSIVVGVVGLGMMGSSIVIALLRAGHPVIAIAPVAGELAHAPARIEKQLQLCAQSGLLSADTDVYRERLIVSDAFTALAPCEMVLECVKEKVGIKAEIFDKIAAAVGSETIIASNTSAIPIGLLQAQVKGPQRFIGVHWAEPAYATRFMEVVCGEQTSMDTAQRVLRIASLWGKEPILLKKDIRGFITNRLMYAVSREVLHLVETGAASLDDVDSAFRYDAGSWITLTGIFRRMEMEGVEHWRTILENLIPLLCSSGEIPAIMQRIVDGGEGEKRTLFDYPGNELQEWREAFARFNKDIYLLAARYPSVPSNT